MSVYTNQTSLNETTSFFALAGNNSQITASNIKANTLTVSTIGNLFNYTGVSTTTFQPIFFDQLAPVGSQMPKLEMKLRQRALDAGAVQSLRWGTDYKNGTAYINSEWDGYLPMPLEMNLQNLTIQDETGVCMYVDNQVTQVPQLSTINTFTANINGQPYVAPTYLSSTSNYSNAFTFNSGSNVTLFSYGFGSIIPSGVYEYSVPISFNASNSPGVTSLILEVYGGGVNIDSNTTCIFDQKTNDFVFYTLRGQVTIGGASPAIVVSGTCIDTFDVLVQSYSGPQTAILKKIA